MTGFGKIPGIWIRYLLNKTLHRCAPMDSTLNNCLDLLSPIGINVISYYLHSHDRIGSFHSPERFYRIRPAVLHIELPTCLCSSVVRFLYPSAQSQ